MNWLWQKKSHAMPFTNLILSLQPMLAVFYSISIYRFCRFIANVFYGGPLLTFAMESGEVFTIFGELWNNIDQSESFWFYKPCQKLRSTPYKVNLTFSLSSGFALKYINVLFHNFFLFSFSLFFCSFLFLAKLSNYVEFDD